jgi:TPR repeat protein
MKAIVLAAVLLAASAPAALAQKYGNPENYGPTPHESPAGEGSGPVSRDSAAIAEDLRMQGKCDKAVPILRVVVDRGPGYQISQFDLGECLLDLAKAEKDAKKVADMREEAATWIVRAADGGFNRAQAAAVTLYLDGTGVAPDPVEAQKWALLYHANGTRLALGLPDIPSDVRDRLDGVLTDSKRAEARSRADAWVAPPIDQ